MRWELSTISARLIVARPRASGPPAGRAPAAETTPATRARARRGGIARVVMRLLHSAGERRPPTGREEASGPAQRRGRPAARHARARPAQPPAGPPPHTP